jgi:hypothetical protein
MRTGSAPQYLTALAEAMKVTVGTMTASPGPTPAMRSATWRAAVPLEQATAYRAPAMAATASSNLGTYSPAADSQPLSRQSRT